ncbi:MAG: TadE/TadG family type IV pilus assembly protein [Prolixibacteraceae bacterium]|nr:TadE/TadG family type IV pilus assembly protein [Prolixibacteraceae bacterium]
MKQKKGQALIEFVVILPVLLLLILNTIEFGNILYEKYRLENNLDYIVDLYNDDKYYEIDLYLGEKNLIINYDDSSKIEIKKRITIYSPGLNLIFENPYYITAERDLYVK